jgi:hypothetical protein
LSDQSDIKEKLNDKMEDMMRKKKKAKNSSSSPLKERYRSEEKKGTNLEPSDENNFIITEPFE